MSLMEPLEGDAPLTLPHFPCFSPPLAPPGSSDQLYPPTLSNQQQHLQEPSSLGCGEAPAIDWASLFLPSSIGLHQPTPAGLLQSVDRPSEGEGNNATNGGGGRGKEKGKGGRAKKVSRPKFAFQTRSANDILDDGYRWRKYGQKAVKNSIYPRFV